MKNKSSKLIKYSVIIGVILIALTAIIMIFINLFSGSNENRYVGIENHKLTKAEKKSVKEKINELEKVKDVDVYIKSKEIRIFVKLSEDVDFEKVKAVSNEALAGISEKNLEFYDVGIFITSDSKDSEVYPQIGSKHKTSKSFSW